ncbi:hypothetical protein EDC01DRAFT_788046 [Geopyxis carbonaria]|nr:hypothetical protein EDC01DRAFT_788046 [Geopyxis carbonaria]
MTSTPSANTLLPPAVRVAKMIGTVGSAYAAGAYLAHGVHVLPALTTALTSPPDLATTLSVLHTRISTPLLTLVSTSSAAFAYIAYHLRNTPTLTVPIASIVLQPGSFLPHAVGREIVVGGGWEVYAVAAATLAAVLPWQILGVGRVEKRILAEGEAVRVARERGLRTAVVKGDSVRGDAESWGRGLAVSGVVVGLGAVVGGWAVAWL